MKILEQGGWLVHKHVYQPTKAQAWSIFILVYFNLFIFKYNWALLKQNLRNKLTPIIVDYGKAHLRSGDDHRQGL